ncbi:MAG: FAD-dependent oxidoreductase, partial [Candidatus Cybelea sp.]
HKALLFEMMGEAGVTLLLHAYFLASQLDGATLTGASFATIGGTRTRTATVTIDATADALVAASAGVPTQQGDERGRVQPATLIFRLSHVDLEQLAQYVREHPDEMRSSLSPQSPRSAKRTAMP